MKTVNLLIMMLFTLFFIRVNANVKIPTLVGNNMVLQRDAHVNIWGWADPGEKITIQIDGDRLSTKADGNGNWQVVTGKHDAGGPYEMIIKGKNKIILKNILFGEVWLASGQSNMEFPLRLANNAVEEIRTSDNSQIRLFEVEREYGFTVSNDVISKGWQVCNPTTVKSYSAVTYLFGKELYKKYKVPIGIINSSWGGTAAEVWISKEGLKSFPNYIQAIDSLPNQGLDKFIKYQHAMEEWKRGTDVSLTSQKVLKELKIDKNKKVKLPFVSAYAPDLKGYDGTVWFSKNVDLDEDFLNQNIILELGHNIYYTDSLFFNGNYVGSSTEYDTSKYVIPCSMLRLGNNNITIRVDGFNGLLGIFGTEDEFTIKSENRSIPIAEDWLYVADRDLKDMPNQVNLPGFLPFCPNIPSLLFNAMINPLSSYTIKGTIWYQGESNAGDFNKAKEYYSLFPALIKDWRNKWGYEFPFVFTQLANFQADSIMSGQTPWAMVREAQFKALSLSNTGMATTIDIGEEDNIHPTNKQDVAKRLVLAACKVAYGEDVVSSGPTLKKIVVEGNKIRVSFDNLGSGISVDNKYGYVNGFVIAGNDKNFVTAKAYQESDEIIVFSEQVVDPVAVRYNWGNSPDGNLYNKEKLPAVPFRSDDW